MTDEHCDLICIDAPRAEAIREKLPAEEAAQDPAGALAMLPMILWQGWETLGEAREGGENTK
jgi:hypothetical protein